MGSVGPAAPFLSESCVGRDFGVEKKLEKRMRFCLFLCSSFFLGHFHVIGFNLSVLMFKLYGTFFFFINQMILHSEKNSIWHIVCVSQCQ